MTVVACCPKCGIALEAGVPEGLCPKCLLAAGLESGAIGQLDETTGPAGPSPPQSAEELARLFPQFESLELIGRGGMGAVYKARQPSLDRFVAIKVLPPEIARDPAFAERFTREARALARLNHSNIVTVHDVGQADGVYYFVMEYVEGINLRQAIQRASLGPQQSIAVVRQICDALQYAHDEGIVHRDIKPENILLDRKGRVKIADFGLAKLLGRTAPELTLTGTHQVMGTLRYMAPEQLEDSREVDHRADIFSLGVVFYELLTGDLPMGRFAPPSQKVELDVRLDEVVLKALAREPALRYQQISQISSDVDSISRTPPPAMTTGGQATDANVELERVVVEALRQGTIPAIKAYRERTASSLADAAKAVEAIAVKHGVAIPPTPLTWRALVLGVAIVGFLTMLIMSVKWDVSPALIGLAFTAFMGIFAAEWIRARGTPPGWQSGILFLANLMFLMFWLAVNHERVLSALYRITGGDPGQHDAIVFSGVALAQVLWIVPTMIRLARRMRAALPAVTTAIAGAENAGQAPHRWRLKRGFNDLAMMALFIAGCMLLASVGQFVSERQVSWWIVWTACHVFGSGLANLRRPAPAAEQKAVDASYQPET